MHHRSSAYRLFSLFNYTFLAAIGLACLLPLVHVLAVSLSGKDAATANLVNLWPIDFTTSAYKLTIENSHFLQSVLVAVKRTAIGTVCSMFFTTIAAFSLSKESHILRGRNVYTWYFLITLLFNGGLIPTYLVIQKLGLINSFWVLILPGLVSVWNLVLLLNFFRGVPKELEEAAFIDGAGYFRSLFQIFLPLSLPAIATMSLFTMVGHWNSWFDGLIYLTKADKYPLATFLQTIIVQMDFTRTNIRPEDMEELSNRTVKAAQIFIGSLPILLVYPFLQRFFVKGIVLGAVKE
ncbi:carbohydrate ABC transporter permease [Paenibacillus cymbidii]|uniref:carbohydrate ABC transporter permease n=1 Tax=Paenibacillus cymbidii TaxID=1639034 RepID=UPI00108048F8|nr:carbohydrate ABC transporter permease [Paenibacillus cymbidii]